MNDTTTVTHSSGKPVPQAPPFLLHLCRFFNELCESVVKIWLAVIGVSIAIVFVVLGATYALGWVVLHVFSDPFEAGSGFNAAMNTGVNVLALIVVIGAPTVAIALFLSFLHDIWKKTGRAK